MLPNRESKLKTVFVGCGQPWFCASAGWNRVNGYEVAHADPIDHGLPAHESFPRTGQARVAVLLALLILVFLKKVTHVWTTNPTCFVSPALRPAPVVLSLGSV